MRLIKRRRASSIAEVVDIMTALERELSRSDGLWWFNRLYLRVTLAVRSAVTTTTFRDPAFLERLDVVFANQYFDAVAAGDADPRAAPSAWRPLFECRHRRGILSIQFALAGMNAHINRDLPAGIVATYAATDGAPRTERRPLRRLQHRQRICSKRSKRRSRASSQPVSWALVDAAGGEADDAVAMWKVRSGARGGLDERRGAVGAADDAGVCATRSSRAWTASRGSRAVDSWSRRHVQESDHQAHQHHEDDESHGGTKKRRRRERRPRR